MEILIESGRLVNPPGGKEGMFDILIEDGVVVKIAKHIRRPAAKKIAAKGCLVLPGLVDCHCHLREPGREDEETIATGTRAAVRGGFTTICCMANTEPPLDGKVPIRFIRDRAEKEGACEVLPIGAVTVGRQGAVIAPYGEMVEEGAVAFSDDGCCVMDSLVMRRALEYTRLFGKPVISHAEDQVLAKNGVMNEGFLSLRLGLSGIPRQAEEIMVARDISLAVLTGGRLHCAHLTTAEAVELVRRAKRSVKTVTAEAAIHHCVLTEEAVRGYNAMAKVSPPLRTEKDIEALCRGLKDGTIDCLVTDHAPHTDEEKETGFEHAPFGMIGFETALPLAFSLRKRGLTLREIVGMLTSGPARVLGIGRGIVVEGGRADVVIVDPDRQWTYARETVISKSKNSPFIGKTLTGMVLVTIAAGKIVYTADR